MQFSPDLGHSKDHFALPAALAAALLLTAAQPAAAQPGWVLSHQKISDTEGGFTGTLDDGDEFGISVTSLGDLDGDGVRDLAVGAMHDDDGGFDRGAVWVLFLSRDGTVKSHQKISDTEGGFTGTLDDRDYFGTSATALGDLDGDGVGDLAAGAIRDADGGFFRGCVWVLFLKASGTVKAHQKISDTQGGFIGILDDWDIFGASVASLGDLDGDRVGDLAGGALGRPIAKHAVPKNLSTHAAGIFQQLRDELDTRHDAADRMLLTTVDGSYTNKNVLRNLPQRSTLVRRVQRHPQLVRAG